MKKKKEKDEKGQKKKPLPCVKTGRPGANSITATEIKFHRCFVRFAREKRKEGGEGRKALVPMLNFVCFFRAPR